MTLIIENANKDLEKAIKAMAKIANVRVRAKESSAESKAESRLKSSARRGLKRESRLEPSIAKAESSGRKSALQLALEEYEADKKAGRIKTYDSFEEFEKDLA